jgi:hypothetical protein
MSVVVMVSARMQFDAHEVEIRSEAEVCQLIGSQTITARLARVRGGPGNPLIAIKLR